MNIQIDCHCGRVEIIAVRSRDYINWRAGMYVQDAFPYLSPEQRECLILNKCSHCVDAIYSSFSDE